jgi:segregation and condensation protein A
MAADRVTESVTKDAIALLIDLAERGEIDPWDVQVIDIVDRFLARLIDNDRKDLYDSGQALLYASMLVLLKANTLAAQQEAYQEMAAELEPYFDGAETADQGAIADLRALPKELEQSLRRRPVAPPPANRRTTLAELIAQIESIAAAVDQANFATGRSRPSKRPTQSKVSRRAAMKAIGELAHKENLSEVVSTLEQYLQRHRIQQIGLNELGTALQDRVGVFWGLLLLSAQSKVELQQDNFYGEIQVIPTLTEPEYVITTIPTAPIDSQQLHLHLEVS